MRGHVRMKAQTFQCRNAGELRLLGPVVIGRLTLVREQGEL
jgi:hypothetical protein